MNTHINTTKHPDQQPDITLVKLTPAAIKVLQECGTADDHTIAEDIQALRTGRRKPHLFLSEVTSPDDDAATIRGWQDYINAVLIAALDWHVDVDAILAPSDNV